MRHFVVNLVLLARCFSSGDKCQNSTALHDEAMINDQKAVWSKRAGQLIKE